MVISSLKVEEPSENCRTMAGATDWTERHRPSSERQLEGNEVQRRKIRAWLDEWKNGNPRKKALLLVGPPGVGKTSVARAIAQDMGWNVIELNASDARNAAAIRKVATHGSTHRSLFHNPDAKKQRTLVLLDEVDHLSGGLMAVSQNRIEKAMQGEDEKGKDVSLKGDSGGKAELLNLLAETRQPVILACNEIMGVLQPSVKKLPFSVEMVVHRTLCSKQNLVSMYDSSGSIGRRYARADEIGVPKCITVDHQSLEDQTVTIRERDSGEQHRVDIDSL